MSLLQTLIARKPCSCTIPLSALNANPNSRPFCFFSLQNPNSNPSSSSHYSSIFSSTSPVNPTCPPKPRPLFAISPNSDSSSDHDPDSKPKTTRPRRKPESPRDGAESSSEIFPTTIPRKPRRGRRSEAVAVEDFVRDSLDRTFKSIRKQNAEVLENKEKVLKERFEHEVDSDNDDDDDKHRDGKKDVVEEDDPDWPLDADVGWGTRASEYFEKHPIRNVVREDGVEIDWEGEIDDNWVKEINCLEWESFAFHPSPLIVLLFERYERATDNWRLLKELERAIKVYWNAKDRLPPRTVKIDINIERDLAYALKVKECPQLLFLRGNKILYREKAIRTTDEIVNMIAYFYYNAKKPSWIDDAALAP